MDMGLQGIAVMVTGSSSRIGRATAVAFAREGARVVVTYHRDRAAGEMTARRVEAADGTALLVQLDLADEASIEAAVHTVRETVGEVGVLVNNAVAWPGFPEPGERFETAPVERFRASLRANLEGHYLLARAVVGGMRAQGWGRIVHISTGLVEDGLPGASAYVAAKAGLHGLTRTMSRELARDGILTNLVMPGFTREASDQRELPERVRQVADKAREATATGRLSEPEDTASLIVYLGSRANTHVTGELIRADGHFLAPL
jgi:3-oxoacyl-[acyl-carrier protein] reductase